MCWSHKLETLRRSRDAALRRGAVGEAPVRFVVIVARQAAELSADITQKFLDDPRVQVLVDRRRGERRVSTAGRRTERRRAERRRVPDYWEDPRHHPVVIVPTWKKPAPPATPAARGGEEDRSMAAPDDAVQTSRRLEAWIRESRHVLAEVIPALLAENQELRRRAETAEATAARRQRELEELQAEVTRLGVEVERLGTEHANLVTAVERGVTSIARLAAEVQAALSERGGEAHARTQ